ncbi:hypothetical protein HYQ46_010802 [Verticillium longisporum]|nr:hypothetical protein HYQ46_010802 [Verticillium longisporum]
MSVAGLEKIRGYEQTDEDVNTKILGGAGPVQANRAVTNRPVSMSKGARRPTRALRMPQSRDGRPWRRVRYGRGRGKPRAG